MEIGDAEDVYRYRSMPEVSKYQGWEPKDHVEIVQFIRQMRESEFLTPEQWFQFSVTLRDAADVIGDIGLHGLDDRRQVEIGISLNPAFQSRGFAFEAVDAMLEQLFSKTDTHRVSASIDPRNRPSLRLFQKLGFRKEAHFRESVRFKGEWADDVVFGMLRSEWEQRPSAEHEDSSRPADAVD